MNKTIIISAFPGCGKSTLHKNPPEGWNVFDSDSSLFNTEHFPTNYIEHIKAVSNGTGNKIIMVSSHEDVRKRLLEEGIPYILVYPSKDIKQEYLNRYTTRGNSEGFLKLLNENWDTFIESCKNDKTNNHLVLKQGEYLVDKLQWVL